MEYLERSADLSNALQERRLTRHDFSERHAQLWRSHDDQEREILEEKKRLGVDTRLAQEQAYQASRERARARGRYPSHQPVEWHREERREEARWQEQAFHSPEDERALEEYFNMRRYGEKGLEAWDQGETETEMLTRRKAEHQAELRARLDALDDEWDQTAQETDTTTHREKIDAFDQWSQHRPFVKRRTNRQGIVFQNRGSHPENMSEKYNRKNRVPEKGNFAPEKKNLDE